MDLPVVPQVRHFMVAPEEHCTFYLGFVTHDTKLNLVKKLSIPAVGNQSQSLQSFVDDALS